MYNLRRFPVMLSFCSYLIEQPLLAATRENLERAGFPCLRSALALPLSPGVRRARVFPFASALLCCTRSMIPRSLPYRKLSALLPLLGALSLTPTRPRRRSPVNFFLATSSLTFQLTVLYPWHITLDEGFRA